LNQGERKKGRKDIIQCSNETQDLVVVVRRGGGALPKNCPKHKAHISEQVQWICPEIGESNFVVVVDGDKVISESPVEMIVTDSRLISSGEGEV
jgi:N-methylhydantoinase B/oxoprolinase/acetone carboxylase alpha subunit